MRRGSILVWFGGLAAAACSGPATPEQRQREEDRLLSPLAQVVEVACSELAIEFTGNFYSRVTQPAVDSQMHTVRKEQGAGYVDTIWTSRLGDPASAFVFRLGSTTELTEPGRGVANGTTFRVLNQLRHRVYEDARPLTFSASGRGPILLVRDKGSERPRDVREFQLADGVLVCR